MVGKRCMAAAGPAAVLKNRQFARVVPGAAGPAAVLKSPRYAQSAPAAAGPAAVPKSPRYAQSLPAAARIPIRKRSKVMVTVLAAAIRGK
jgi:hypothetical protein